ncbi:class F sortase [Micromonospora maritima]|uniref:class F sortase n=1 Tax=Micromonospora maritima TaxID=986711 RepID=UPI0037AEB490
MGDKRLLRRWNAPAAIAAGAAVLALAFGPARPTPPVTTVGAEAARRLAQVPQEPNRTIIASVPPVRLRIPALGVTAEVDQVGVDARTGNLEVPADVRRAGWYRYGPALDAGAGSLVLAGHVDGTEQGPGAFFHLRALSPGDAVTVTGADGRDRKWRVVARESYPKGSLPSARYFSWDEAARLTLITCGGPLDETARAYRDNVVVTAVPA